MRTYKIYRLSTLIKEIIDYTRYRTQFSYFCFFFLNRKKNLPATLLSRLWVLWELSYVYNVVICSFISLLIALYFCQRPKNLLLTTAPDLRFFRTEAET